LSFNNYSIGEKNGMLCFDDMCTFHALYMKRERRVEEKDSIVDEKKITPYRYKQQRKISINIKYIETK